MFTRECVCECVRGCVFVYENNICEISQFEESESERVTNEGINMKMKLSFVNQLTHTHRCVAKTYRKKVCVCWAHIFYGSNPNRRINQITSRNRATAAAAVKNGTSSLSISIMSMAHTHTHTSSRSTNENNTCNVTQRRWERRKYLEQRQ